MKYDFTTIMDRRGMDAIAVDQPPRMPSVPGFDLIPMWVADMNFATVPTVVDSMIRRAQHPAFGYFSLREEYYNGIQRWHKTHHDVDLKPEFITYANGVLGGVVSALGVLCSKGDKVLVHSPTYVGFTHSLGSNGYEIVHSPLKLDQNGIWRMDFEDMEEKLRTQKIHTTILCSPHNPTGRVWEKWELEKAMALYAKYDVNVVSDEIWSDILRPGVRHIPTQSVSEDAKQRTIAFYAPSKTFNLAGLIGSYHIIYNQRLSDRMEKECSLSHYNSMNVLSMYALLGAYQEEGYEWVEELKQVIAGNVDFACDYIQKYFDGVSFCKPQGTYMLFIDCEKWLIKHGKTMDELLKAGWDVGVVWQDGRDFHGKTHIRLNLALPLSRVREAFERLDKYVFNG